MLIANGFGSEIGKWCGSDRPEIEDLHGPITIHVHMERRSEERKRVIYDVSIANTGHPGTGNIYSLSFVF